MTLSPVNVKSVTRNAQLHSQKAEDVAGYQVKLVNHDITRGKKQLHPLEVEHTRKALFIGCVRGCSISGSDWHIQQEVLGESHEVFSGCIGGTVEALLVFRTEDIRGNGRVPGYCSSTSWNALGG